MPLIHLLVAAYRRVSRIIDTGLGDILPGFLARLVFAATLSLYFLNSAMTKTGDGLFGFFQIQPAAWYQIAPQAVDAALGDIDAIGFFPWGLVVTAGTYAEYLLPMMVVFGLFTRLSALGMIGFITVRNACRCLRPQGRHCHDRLPVRSFPGFRHFRPAAVLVVRPCDSGAQGSRTVIARRPPRPARPATPAQPEPLRAGLDRNKAAHR